MQTFVIVWTPGPRWIEGDSIYEQPYIGEHADHLDQLMSENRIVLSGPFTMPAGTPPSSVGMTVVTAADEASLRAWLVADPAIVHQVLTAELRPFQIIFEAQDDGEAADHAAL